MPIILVIDDDPAVAASVRDAVPGWTVLEAADGAEGIAQLRRRADIALVVLDVQMPHDGVLTCVQIRAHAPRLPILPFTGAAEHADALIRLGCAPPLLKPAGPLQIAQAIQDATDIAPPPLLHDPLLDYMRGVAAHSEQALLQSKQHAPRVVVLASSDMLLGGLRGMLTAAGGAVRVASTDAATLRGVLMELRAGLLVADTGVYAAARDLAREFDLALLLVARTLAEGLRALDDGHSVVVEPVTTGLLAEALRALAQGDVYQDERLRDPFAGTPLTRAERAIGMLVLRGHDSKQIARDLTLQPDTARWHLANIYRKLAVAGMEGLRGWAAARRSTPE